MKKSVSKKILVLTVALALILQSMMGIVFADTTFTGDGSAANPYQIGTYAELAAFRDYVDLEPFTGADKHVILTADIAIPDGVNWYAIGAEAAPYSGTFDGNGHKITGFYQSVTGWKAGFFRRTNGATIKNLTIEGEVVSTSTYAGGLIGEANNTTVDNCKFIGNVTCVGGNAGGFISMTDQAFTTERNTIKNSAFIGNVTNNAITGNASGFAYSKTDVTNSYFAGNVTGNTEVSGVGFNSTATNCFAYGTLTANTTNGYVCRIAGTATNCYYMNSVSKNLAGQGTQATAYDFASGKIAYLINQSAEKEIFGQTIGTDDYPVFATADNKVIQTEDGGYANEGKEEVEVSVKIGTYAELAAFRDSADLDPYTGANQNVILTADIVIPDGVNWYWIGGAAKPYSGTFDGNGHKISNMNLTTSSWHAGFFGWTDGATIKNLTVEGNVTSTKAYVGGLIGTANNTTIENVKFIGNVTGVGGTIAGFIGRTDNADFTKTNNTIKNSAFIGNVTNSATSGSASGFAYSKTDATNSYFAGNVTGNTEVSGVGFNSTATNCFAYGTLTANTTNGYVCKVAGTATNCYYMNSQSKYLAGQGTQSSAYDFATGKIAYLINQSAEKEIFGQTIGTDDYPVFATADNKVIQNANGDYINEGGEPLVYVAEIGSYNDLVAFRDMVNNGFADLDAVLTADIDMSADANWYAIGVSTAYSGTFDGKGYKITGFTQTPTGWYGGFFRSTDGAIIKNLTLEGNVTSTSDRAGGMIGMGSGTTITNCTVKVNVSANSVAGGFIGHTDEATAENKISYCVFEGNVTTTGSGASGFARSNTSIENSYYIDAIMSNCITGKGEVSAFGLYAKVKNSFAFGGVSATGSGQWDKAYPISADASSVSNCYYIAEMVSGQYGGGGTGVSMNDFMFGKIAYLLNQNAGEVIYGQTIEQGFYPVFYNNNMVYKSGDLYVNGSGAFAGVNAEKATVIATTDTFVMVAQYAKDGDVETLLGVTPVNVSANQLYTQDITPISGADVYKVFVWNSMAGMIPVCNNAEYAVVQ